MDAPPPILVRTLTGQGTDFLHLYRFNSHRIKILFAHKPPKFNAASPLEIVRLVFTTRLLIIAKKRRWKRRRVKALLHTTVLPCDLQNIIMGYV